MISPSSSSPPQVIMAAPSGPERSTFVWADAQQTSNTLAIPVAISRASSVWSAEREEISISSHFACHGEHRCAEQTLDGVTCFGGDGGEVNDVPWNPGTEAWIVYDMGVARMISSVTIWHQNEYNACQRHISGYDLSYSDSPDSGFVLSLSTRDFECRQTSARQCPNLDVDTTEVPGGNSARY
jgi:hypothetical protein